MVMTISLQRPLNVGVIKGIVRLAKNDYLKEFESILQNGRVAARSGFYLCILYLKLQNGTVMVRRMRVA